MARSRKRSKKAPPGPVWLKGESCPHKAAYLAGRRILPKGISGKEKLPDLIDQALLAYNGARLRRVCELYAEKMLQPDVTVGMSLAGALTPGGLGVSCIVPLIKAGFVDWIVSTGANLYHDLHFALNCPLHAGTPRVNDEDLRKNDVVRIYDVFLSYTDVLAVTDKFVEDVLATKEFQREMGTAELHYRLGKHAAEQERKNGLKDVSILAAAYRADVPVYTSSPGDSAIGMESAADTLRGGKLRVDPAIDVNETTALVLHAKRSGGKNAAVMMGGGSPKNFMLQTEPQIQEVLRIPESGHDYFLQVTDARPDTGGLSGATPQEAVSWGKVDPATLPDAVVCYADATIVLPLLTHYALARHPRRKLKRLYKLRGEMMSMLVEEYYANNPQYRDLRPEGS
jgi:deoxyhypusine synthase